MCKPQNLQAECKNPVIGVLLFYFYKILENNYSNRKQRHYFANKGPSSQSCGFSSSHVWMWELDYIKKAERWRTDAFELWCWKRLLRIPWTARRSNQSILKEISPEYSLEGLMLKLKLQFWPPDVKNWLIWRDPDTGKDWRQENRTTEDDRVGWHHWLDGHEFKQASGAGEGQGSLVYCSPWGLRVGHNWVTELDWLTESRSMVAWGLRQRENGLERGIRNFLE